MVGIKKLLEGTYKIYLSMGIEFNKVQDLTDAVNLSVQAPPAASSEFAGPESVNCSKSNLSFVQHESIF